MRETTKSRRRNTERPNLGLLVDGWLELESDPGTFSLLIEDFGCFGAQVDEVYDLDQKFEGPVYGFIFLFKWLNDHHNRSSTSRINYGNGQSSSKQITINQSNDHQWSYVMDENIIRDMFFAKQMISNSCATHALISILLNCDHEELSLGPTLNRLKEHTRVMDPESKGHAIGNVPELAKVHNSHASYSSLYARDRPSVRRGAQSFVIRGNQRTNMQQQQNQPDTYHFVSYVPINDRLYELDGLKNYPIDHGPYDPKEGWTEKFRQVIKHRLFENNSASNDGTMADDIRYNLMAVVPDKRIYLRAQLQNLKHHLKSAENSLRQLTKQVANSKPTSNISTCISVATDNRDLNPPSSPCSNGTLTASENESTFHDQTNRDVHMDNGDNNASTSDIELPNPPYSPISIRTLTASEAGSDCNDPVYYDDTLFQEDFNKPKGCSYKDLQEMYFFVKFDPKRELEDKVSDSCPDLVVDRTSAMEDMCKLTNQLKVQIEKLEYALKEEHEKRRKLRLDNSRRTHNYEPFIMTFLSLLAKHGKLADLIEKDLGVATTQSTPQPKSNPTPKYLQRLAPPKTPPSNQTNNATHSHNLKPRHAQKSHGPVQSTTQERDILPQKPKNKYYKYVSTGRPRGRPRKNPIVTVSDNGACQ